MRAEGAYLKLLAQAGSYKMVDGRLRLAGGARVLGRSISDAPSLFRSSERGGPGERRLGLIRAGLPLALGRMGWWLLIVPLIAGIVIGIAMLSVGKRCGLVERTSATLTRNTRASALLGALALAVMLLAVRVVGRMGGIAAALPVAFVVGVVILASAMIPAPIVGAYIGRAAKRELCMGLRIAVGAAAILVFALVPLVGPLALIGAATPGLGALAVDARSAMSARRLGRVDDSA